MVIRLVVRILLLIPLPDVKTAWYLRSTGRIQGEKCVMHLLQKERTALSEVWLSHFASLFHTEWIRCYSLNSFVFFFEVLKDLVFISVRTSLFFIWPCEKSTKDKNSCELSRHVQIKVTEQKALWSALTWLCLCSLQVISEQRQRGGVFLGVGPLFQLSENRQKLHRFISQYLYN